MCFRQDSAAGPDARFTAVRHVSTAPDRMLHKSRYRLPDVVLLGYAGDQAIGACGGVKGEKAMIIR